MLAIGSTLDGRYEILARLAEGGMGAIYRARRAHLGDEVAIKVVQHPGDQPTVRERFMRESRIAAQLRHPNVVTILDFAIDPGGWPYLVMELLNGPSLRQELADEGSFDVGRVQAIVPPLCDALQMAHDRGILHRDLKPANVVGHRFESGQRVYKIIDFGLANVRASADETRLTSEHHFAGTIGYAAPEQLRGLDLDCRTDVYALALIVFELLTGRPPFEGPDPMAIVTGHLTAMAPRPSALRPGLPPWIDATLLRALAKTPGDRWPSIAEFGRALAGPSTVTLVSDTVSTKAPALLDNYRLDRIIARGRLGSEVYAGVHRALGHPVAIRVIRRADRRDWDGVKARFLREAQTLQVVHPSLIQVRDYGEGDDLAFVVTDLIEGMSLRELLDRDGPVAWPRLGRLVGQLIEAAAALHAHGGLIGALDPAIVRVRMSRVGAAASNATPVGRAEPDIGAVHGGERADDQLLVSSAGICQVRDLLATLDERTLRGDELVDSELRYVAPEVLTGQTSSVRSDIFTLGAVAYEMATGHVPFDAPSLPQLIGVMLGGVAPDPRLRAPSLPDAAAECLRRCLERDPAARFATAKAMADAWH